MEELYQKYAGAYDSDFEMPEEEEEDSEEEDSEEEEEESEGRNCWLLLQFLKCSYYKNSGYLHGFVQSNSRKKCTV